MRRTKLSILRLLYYNSINHFIDIKKMEEKNRCSCEAQGKKCMCPCSCSCKCGTRRVYIRPPMFNYYTDMMH